MKVVYNNCYGGFGLSDAAIARYWQLKGEPKPEGWWHYDLAREDPLLVQVVEELGKAAGTSFADLQIANVPTGTRWRIDEYDGNECVKTIDDYNWKVAT